MKVRPWKNAALQGEAARQTFAGRACVRGICSALVQTSRNSNRQRLLILATEPCGPPCLPEAWEHGLGEAAGGDAGVAAGQLTGHPA